MEGGGSHAMVRADAHAITISRLRYQPPQRVEDWSLEDESEWLAGWLVVTGDERATGMGMALAKAREEVVVVGCDMGRRWQWVGCRLR
jgi:hypothetical protein